jgi:excisionase family DNA binding protein
MSSEATQLPELMTVAEVAKLWRQRRETIYRKVASGEVRAVRLGDETAALRIPRAEVERINATPNVSDDGCRQGQLRADATPAERRVPGPAPAVEARQPAGGER